MEFDKEIDARGLNCPLPILRCKKGLSDLAATRVLRVIATDPGSVKDFQAFCRQTGHALELQEEMENAQSKKEFIFYIRKRSE